LGEHRWCCDCGHHHLDLVVTLGRCAENHAWKHESVPVMARISTLTGLLSVLVLAACSSDPSYLVVSATTPVGKSLTGVTRFRVDLQSGIAGDRLYYPRLGSNDAGFATGGANLSLSATVPISFSVSFPDKLTGTVTIGITALDETGTVRGCGSTQAKISRGETVRVPVVIDPGATACPPKTSPNTDGGVADAGTADTAPTPDGGAISCSPEGALGCGAQATCALSCMGAGATTQCTPAGTGVPGSVCEDDSDCSIGSQCFVEACGVKVCRKYCATNPECGGNGASCLTEIQCDGAPNGSGHRICSQPCDPRGLAQTGCAAGLKCFVFPGEVVDCDCVGAKRTGMDGDACQTSANCGAGLLCITMGVDARCRPVCRHDTPTDCPANRSCETLISPALTTFGACVPR
jgi:hypothetical protein